MIDGRNVWASDIEAKKVLIDNCYILMSLSF
ncbi:hypothetical protein ACVXZ0_17010 [Staphylococcus aureus]